MQRHNTSRSSRCISRSFLTMLCTLLLISLLIIVTFSSYTSYPPFIFPTKTTSISNDLIYLPYSLHSQVTNLQTQLGVLLQQLHNESSDSKTLARFSDQVLQIALSLDKLADGLSRISSNAPASDNEMSKVDEDSSEPEESEEDQERSTSVKNFNARELHDYISSKPNRQDGKKIFLGVEAISPSIGLSCANMPTNVDRFMSYKMYGMCPDDWDLAQKLIAAGCDPLPRRRCLSRPPPKYSKPLPVNSSLWSQPSNCFNLSKRGWENEAVSAEFTIEEVLGLKPGEIRVGLDFSPTTGTFAALMKERNVTIASATLNLGAPFNEVIALRDLPRYLDEFAGLGYKKLLWRVVPKTDKLEGELFLSAVLEKPIRR
ncbi:hypothetical protein RCOM_0917420 [Ricinus communis]|uniref:Methyltransferase n=1 Tax=Ricinus communis TaxID=3988 RepID=B9SYC9_RICCO|nr:hypothetical protein RCOM_0917420 [Ricinus communis]